MDRIRAAAPIDKDARSTNVTRMKLTIWQFAVLYLFLLRLSAVGAQPVGSYDNAVWDRLAGTLGNYDVRNQPIDEHPAPRDVFILPALRNFLESPPDPMKPLQRAVMQRDLLAVFHQWVLWHRSEREMIELLAHAIKRVALSETEIRDLPNNYLAAASAPGAVTAYDMENPGPFLPKNLLDDEGPWIRVEVKAARRLAAVFHFDNALGGASFEVLMRHPDGRAAGEAYLKDLATMPDPWVNKDSRVELQTMSLSNGPYANPATPQFPVGTMWALVRRVILADAAGQPVVSPLVQSVQIRVYRALSGAKALETPFYQRRLKELEDSKREFDRGTLMLDAYQTTFEWSSRRHLLLTLGGFHLTASEIPFDEDKAKVAVKGFTGKGQPQRVSCLGCHSANSIHSVNIRAQPFSERFARPPEFEPVDRDIHDYRVRGEAMDRPSWVLLSWLCGQP